MAVKFYRINLARPRFIKILSIPFCEEIRMRLFGGKSKKEKQFEAEQRQKQLELEKQIIDALRKIYVFPGSKSEFEDFIGYQTSWVDWGGTIKGLIFDWSAENPFHIYTPEFQKEIVDSGVVALVNSNFSYHPLASSLGDKIYFGTPVKKKYDTGI